MSWVTACWMPHSCCSYLFGLVEAKSTLKPLVFKHQFRKRHVKEIRKTRLLVSLLVNVMNIRVTNLPTRLWLSVFPGFQTLPTKGVPAKNQDLTSFRVPNHCRGYNHSRPISGLTRDIGVMTHLVGWAQGPPQGPGNPSPRWDSTEVIARSSEEQRFELLPRERQARSNARRLLGGQEPGVSLERGGQERSPGVAVHQIVAGKHVWNRVTSNNFMYAYTIWL